jgi:hypothetical protein
VWLKGWWAAVFPTVHFYFVVPLVNEMRYHGSVTYSYDRGEFVLVGTIAVAIGAAAGMFLLKQDSDSSTPGGAPPS